MGCCDKRNSSPNCRVILHGELAEQDGAADAAQLSRELGLRSRRSLRGGKRCRTTTKQRCNSAKRPQRFMSTSRLMLLAGSRIDHSLGNYKVSSLILNESNEFKALVYEFVENGDFDTWLYTHSANARTNVLSVLLRLNIAIDVASTLHYLHDDCELAVVHCDLKPNNILLDKELTAHV
ncbi:PREDICTED: lysM domain receptor-like kinase 4 [Ipomoea nil]|uniref:lysM domain receptor-like kinase 4 n=1 Tax=Ipomoea nil TaxID=35883 RepID=UPI000900FD99|nr:PREDICTED: lysM domain receptor-like kinase 4 [Ipomoea nil]